MADWGTLANVQSRLTYRTIDVSSNPTSTNVTGWVEEAEAILKATFQALGFPTSYSNASVVRWLGKLAEDYAEGRTRMAWASADGMGENRDGVDLVESFNAKVEDIFKFPDKYGQLLGVGTSPTTAVFLRSHTTDDVDGRTVEDFAPVITKDEKF